MLKHGTESELRVEIIRSRYKILSRIREPEPGVLSSDRSGGLAASVVIGEFAR